MTLKMILKERGVTSVHFESLYDTENNGKTCSNLG